MFSILTGLSTRDVYKEINHFDVKNYIPFVFKILL